jgi:small subunit ribosomal protein S21
MVFVKVRDGESIEDVLRRFKRDCQRDGIMKELRRREFYVTPSVRKVLKRKEAQRKARRRRTRGGVGRPGGGGGGFSKFGGTSSSSVVKRPNNAIV